MQNSSVFNPVITNNKIKNSSGCIKHFKIFSIALILFLGSLLFNGILVHYSLSISFLSTIRVILPEILILVAMLSMGLRVINLKAYDLCFIILFLLLCILSFESFSADSLLITVRDIFVPFMVLFYISKQKINDNELSKIKIIFKWCFRIFAIVGLVMAIIQDIRGWEYTSKYFLGYEAWGINGSIRVVHGWRGLNCLGSTGNAATFAFYNVIAIICFLFISKPKMIDFVFVVPSMFSIYYSGNKTALLLAVLLIVYYVLMIFSKNAKWATILLAGLSVCVFLFLVFFMDESSWNITLFERFELWGELIEWDYLRNLFIPTSLFLFSSKGGTVGITSFWDNSYIYSLYSFGIIGAIVVFYCLYKYIKPVIKDTFIIALVIFCAVSAFSTNILFGRNCFLMFMLFLGIYNANLKSKNRSVV